MEPLRRLALEVDHQSYKRTLYDIRSAALIEIHPRLTIQAKLSDEMDRRLYFSFRRPINRGMDSTQRQTP